MRQFSHATAESVADFAQGIGVREMAEHHGNALRPAGEAFRAFFGGMLLDQRVEF
jgi:hypothetical protein